VTLLFVASCFWHDLGESANILLLSVLQVVGNSFIFEKIESKLSAFFFSFYSYLKRQ